MPSHVVSHVPRRRTAVAIAISLAVAAWLFDQATKLWVESTMTLGETTEVLPPVLSWRYHLNPGAAFSIGTEYTWIFTIIQVVVLGIAIWQLRRLGGSWMWTLGLGGLIGGVAGNLTDRLFRPPSLVEGSWQQFGQGHVVDFIAVPNFAIFNVADSFIVCSIIGLCALMVFGVGMDGTREHASSTPQSPADKSQENTDG